MFGFIETFYSIKYWLPKISIDCKSNNHLSDHTTRSGNQNLYYYNGNSEDHLAIGRNTMYVSNNFNFNTESLVNNLQILYSSTANYIFSNYYIFKFYTLYLLHAIS